MKWDVALSLSLSSVISDVEVVIMVSTWQLLGLRDKVLSINQSVLCTFTFKGNMEIHYTGCPQKTERLFSLSTLQAKSVKPFTPLHKASSAEEHNKKIIDVVK